MCLVFVVDKLNFVALILTIFFVRSSKSRNPQCFDTFFSVFKNSRNPQCFDTFFSVFNKRLKLAFVIYFVTIYLFSTFLCIKIKSQFHIAVCCFTKFFCFKLIIPLELFTVAFTSFSFFSLDENISSLRRKVINLTSSKKSYCYSKMPLICSLFTVSVSSERKS